MKTLLLFSLFFFAGSLSAAEAPVAAAPKLWIEHHAGLFSVDKITNGKTIASAGFFGNFDVRDLVKDSPDALAHANQAKRFHNYALWSYWAGMLPSAVGLVWGAAELNEGLYWGSLAAFVGTAFLTSWNASRSREQTFQAINRYNGVPLTEALQQNSRRPRSRSLFALSYQVEF